MCLFALSVTLVHYLLSTATCTTYENYQVLRTLPTTEKQIQWRIDLYKNGTFDFWSPSDIMVAPDKVEYLTKELDSVGIPWETLIPDVQTVIDDMKKWPERNNISDNDQTISFTNFYRYDDIVAYLTKLQTRYPNTVNVSNIENSFEARQLLVIKISNGGNGTRPIILIDAGIHAREWLAPAMALYVIHQLVENSSNADLLNNADWHIIPLLNPDGYEYSHTQDRLWRKTRSLFKCQYKRDPHQGVNINRNFDFYWMETGASDSPCNEFYAGPVPFCERETCALRDHMLANAPRVKLYVSLHCCSKSIGYPWAYTSEPSENEKEHVDLARAANNAVVSAGGPPLDIIRSFDMHPYSGGSNDWAKGNGVDLSYTMELPSGPDKTLLVDPSNISKIVSAYFPAVRVLGEYINKT